MSLPVKVENSMKGIYPSNSNKNKYFYSYTYVVMIIKKESIDFN